MESSKSFSSSVIAETRLERLCEESFLEILRHGRDDFGVVRRLSSLRRSDLFILRGRRFFSAFFDLHMMTNDDVGVGVVPD